MIVLSARIKHTGKSVGQSERIIVSDKRQCAKQSYIFYCVLVFIFLVKCFILSYDFCYFELSNLFFCNSLICVCLLIFLAWKWGV